MIGSAAKSAKMMGSAKVVRYNGPPLKGRMASRNAGAP